MIPVTAVVPCYNSEERIEETIDSLVSERFHEIICVNNNSNDATISLLEKLPVFIIEEPRQGTVWARRSGVACAETEWVALIDDDIVLQQGWLDSMIEFISVVAPEAVAVTGYVDTPLPSHLSWAKTILACNCSISTQEYYPWSQPLGSSTFIRRDTFLKYSQRPILVGRDDRGETLEGCGEDIEVFRKILQDGGRVFHNAEAKAVHLIEEWRKDENYLKRLQRAYSSEEYVRQFWA